MTHLGDLTGGLIDGELGDGVHTHAVAHLAECVQCRREVSLHRHVKSLLSAAAIQGEPGDDLLAKLLQIPQFEPFPPREEVRVARFGVRWHPPRSFAAAGFAASVVVGLGGAVAVSGTFTGAAPAAAATSTAGTGTSTNSGSFVPASFVPTGPVGGPMIRHGGRVAATVVYRRP